MNTRYLWFGIALLGALWLGASAGAQNVQYTTGQRVGPPDPTPRQADLHLVLADTPQAGTSTQQALEHQNQKRRELVLWASEELVTLSQDVQADVVKPKTEATTANAAVNAEKIELLAKNLIAALKAQ
jgi:hypothetical protein